MRDGRLGTRLRALIVAWAIGAALPAGGWCATGATVRLPGHHLTALAGATALEPSASGLL